MAWRHGNGTGISGQTSGLRFAFQTKNGTSDLPEGIPLAVQMCLGTIKDRQQALIP
jgi:hypothetical protein